VSWISTAWWNVPLGINFALPSIFPTTRSFADRIYITNALANIPITNPAGTRVSYMSINNFFTSTGVESLFVMALQNPQGAGSDIQINSFEVRFNRI
jgi:hypothetical protein